MPSVPLYSIIIIPHQLREDVGSVRKRCKSAISKILHFFALFCIARAFGNVERVHSVGAKTPNRRVSDKFPKILLQFLQTFLQNILNNFLKFCLIFGFQRISPFSVGSAPANLFEFSYTDFALTFFSIFICFSFSFLWQKAREKLGKTLTNFKLFFFYPLVFEIFDKIRYPIPQPPFSKKLSPPISD